MEGVTGWNDAAVGVALGDLTPAAAEANRLDLRLRTLRWRGALPSFWRADGEDVGGGGGDACTGTGDAATCARLVLVTAAAGPGCC